MRPAFQLIRLGLKRDAASGTHAAIMGKPLTEAGDRLCEAQGVRFAQHWPWIQSCFEHLEPALERRLRTILPAVPEPESTALTEADQRELFAFVHGFRELEPTRLALNRLSAGSDGKQDCWSERDRRLWQRAVIDGAGWETLRRESLIEGRRQGLKRLRELALECLPKTFTPGL